MELAMKVVLQPDEIDEQLHYRLIAEAKHLSRWNTGSRKRKMVVLFTDDEMPKVEEIFSKANRWANNGIRTSVEMTVEEYALWNRLAVFCGTY